MGLKSSQYYAIMREYEKKQLKSHDIQTRRYEEVYEKIPEFKSLMNPSPSSPCSMGKNC